MRVRGVRHPKLEVRPTDERPVQVIVDPGLVVAVALAEAEALKMQAKLVLQREPELGDAPRDMSPLGSRYH